MPVRICGGGDDLNLKQRLLAINTQLDLLCGLTEGLPQRGHGSEPTADPQPRGSRREEPGSVLADKSVPVRQAPPPANRHGHLCAGSLRDGGKGGSTRHCVCR